MTMVTRTDIANPDERNVLDSPRRKVVQELERHGYVVDPNAAGSPGLTIYRHSAAPSLMVCDDGRLELPGGQPHTQTVMLWQAPTKRVHWGRGLLFLTLLGATTFVGLLIVAMVVG